MVVQFCRYWDDGVHCVRVDVAVEFVIVAFAGIQHRFRISLPDYYLGRKMTHDIVSVGFAIEVKDYLRTGFDFGCPERV